MDICTHALLLLACFTETYGECPIVSQSPSAGERCFPAFPEQAESAFFADAHSLSSVPLNARLDPHAAQKISGESAHTTGKISIAPILMQKVRPFMNTPAMHLFSKLCEGEERLTLASVDSYNACRLPERPTSVCANKAIVDPSWVDKQQLIRVPAYHVHSAFCLPELPALVALICTNTAIEAGRQSVPRRKWSCRLNFALPSSARDIHPLSNMTKEFRCTGAQRLRSQLTSSTTHPSSPFHTSLPIPASASFCQGETKLALYGLGNIRDERLGRLFQTAGAVTWDDAAVWHDVKSPPNPKPSNWIQGLA
eukprot:scaffold262824_cov17-Tisochrysis_lutea.AAC.1